VGALSASVAQLGPVIEDIVERLCTCFQTDHKLLLCGNGGSAADAQHVAAEFVNRLCFDRPALPALSLATDTSILTCVANDAAYDQVFARQVGALGREGDVLGALTTSGQSPNVLTVLAVARDAGLCTVGFTGQAGSAAMSALCDYVVAVPSTDCARIQECHGFIWHYVAGSVERRLFGSACG
jgi:D-sedoheptulose 7-phosphate isomerase